MPEVAAKIKESAAPDPAGAPPHIPCLQTQVQHHQWQADHLLPVFRRLSTVAGLQDCERGLEQRGVALPPDGATPEEEAARNRGRVAHMELVERIRREQAYDDLSWIACADEAHVRGGDPDSYAKLEDLGERDFDVTGYVARYAISAGGFTNWSVESQRVRTTVATLFTEAWGEVFPLRDPEFSWVPDAFAGTIFGGGWIGGKQDTEGRKVLAGSRARALAAAAALSVTPAQRYALLALAAAAEKPEICGAMLSAELTHAALVAHQVGAEEDLWPVAFQNAKPGSEVHDVKVEVGRLLMTVARRVLDDEERERYWAEGGEGRQRLDAQMREMEDGKGACDG